MVYLYRKRGTEPFPTGVFELFKGGGKGREKKKKKKTRLGESYYHANALTGEFLDATNGRAGRGGGGKRWGRQPRTRSNKRGDSMGEKDQGFG